MLGEYKLNEIYNEDCLIGMKKLPNECIDLTVTSPPYDNLRTYTGEAEWNFETFKEIVKELYRITKSGGVVVWVVGDATINGSETGTSFRQALYFKEVGFNLHDTMIWKKSNPFNFGSNNCYIQSFEYMFIFSKGKPKSLNFIYDRENKTIKEGQLVKMQRRTRNGDYMETEENKYSILSKMGKRHNVWKIPTSSGKGLHPAVFPEQLAQDHILSWSNENDTVLDPFMGSGTTAKMARLNNRQYIGFEISKKYCEIAKKRLGQTSIFNFIGSD
jgi:site-specific DNA-methyltransferase (adenine-specific)